jgi:hypothetical protein
MSRAVAPRHRPFTAVIEQLLAGPNDGPLADLPSGEFNANAAWLAIAAIAHNLLQAAVA